MNRITIVISVIIFSFLTSSCVKNINYSGHEVDPVLVKRLKKNITTQEQVFKYFGSPSTTTSFKGTKWYYMYSVKESYGFLEPKIIQEEVLELAFNKNDVVTQFNTYSKEDFNKINIIKDKTPARGTYDNPVKHFLKNFGRFNNNKGHRGSRKPGI